MLARNSRGKDAQPISIAENLALGQPAWQSSTGYGGFVHLAVDGNPSATYNYGSCTHTLDIDPNAWWAVDLGAVSDIKSVTITNRVDACCKWHYVHTGP
jgi:hypothetical protein